MAVCLCVIVRTGYGHVSWFILGPVPLLLGKTWIWSEVSNHSFCNYLRKVVAQDAVRGLGAWDGVCWRLRVPAAFAESAWAPAAGRVPPAPQSKAHLEQSEVPVASIICTGATGRQNFPFCSSSPRGLLWLPLSRKRPGICRAFSALGPHCSLQPSLDSCALSRPCPCAAVGERTPRKR